MTRKPMRNLLKVPEGQEGTRLDAFVAASAGLSRSAASGLIDGGSLTVNGTMQRKSYRVAAGDEIAVEEPDIPAPEPPTGVEVAYEDDDLLVVGKPTGVVVHSAPGLHEGTLTDALAEGGRTLAPRAGSDRPGIVHRLDREVSGLLVVAKTDQAHESLTAALARREIERVYLALVRGRVEADSGKIEAPIGRHPRHRTKMTVLPEGRPSVTWFKVLERMEDLTLMEVRLETGRTHQIRVHLASIGHPVVGDAVYGSREPGLGRPFLHAHRLEFEHPTTGEHLSFTSELPDHLAGALEALR
jgi:23S rRNA pseudouridine1911/1915/1917 synthase